MYTHTLSLLLSRTHILIERNSPPPGGFPIYYVPSSKERVEKHVCRLLMREQKKK